MAIEKDTVATTENPVTEVKTNNARAKAREAVKLAVSQYIEELLEKEWTLSKITKKLYDINVEIKSKSSTDTADKDPSFAKLLKNWLGKKNELSLYHLCLLTQVHHVSYDYILGLDANQLSYGYTLDFFSYLFRTKKIEIFRKSCSDLSAPVTTVASKGCFDMTRYFIFKDKTLCDIFKELNEQKVTDITDLQEKNKDEVKNMYRKALQRFISTYENMPLDSETYEIDTDRYNPLTPDNGQNKPSQETYYGLPDDLADRLMALPEKYGKKPAQFAKDAGIPLSTFSDWGGYKQKTLYPHKLYLMAKTYGFSVDSLLTTGISDNNEEKHKYKYTYGNTLRFIDQLQTAGIISKVINPKYFPQLANGSTHHHKNNSDGKNPNNMNYSDKKQAYIPGLYFINDDFLIRLITEMEAEMSRPFDAPQSSDIAQISYELSKPNVEKFIARYNNERLLCYQGNTGKALRACSAKRRKYDYWHNEYWTSLLDMSMDLDEMLKELRAVEINASKASLE